MSALPAAQQILPVDAGLGMCLGPVPGTWPTSAFCQLSGHRSQNAHQVPSSREQDGQPPEHNHLAPPGGALPGSGRSAAPAVPVASFQTPILFLNLTGTP